MRLIVTESIEAKARKIWMTFDDIYDFIKVNRSGWLEELCSPLANTIAYKGYMSNVQRIIIFAIVGKGLVYPVYIWDKNDPIAKNITVQAVRKYGNIRHKQVENEIIERKIKIRHFGLEKNY